MSYLDNLTVTDIEQGHFPLQNILANSLFYPACDNDGGVVKDCNTLNRKLGIENFIYCDYAFGEDRLNEAMDTFHGYSVLASRSLKQFDLIPNRWDMKMPPGLDLRQYHNHREAYKTPFAKWIVYHRDATKEDDFGPARFSLLYIGGEGVATYQAIYWSNNACPKAVAIIQPGHAFGLNWTDFTAPDGFLNWVIVNNPNQQLPEQIYFGGYGTYDWYDELNWEGYKQVREIEQYYGERGFVALYQK